MSTSHPSPVHQAFDVIHEHVRKVERENLSLRAQASQARANVELLTKELADAQWQVTQLRGALARKFGVPAAGGEDITAIVQIVA